MDEPGDDVARAYGAALVREIKVEMARQGIESVRALSEKIGMNHGTLNDRLNRSSRTGERVAIGAEDLWRIAAALNIQPAELVRRAAVDVGGSPGETSANEAG